MNYDQNGRKGYGEYRTDEYGNIRSSDGRFVGSPNGQAGDGRAARNTVRPANGDAYGENPYGDRLNPTPRGQNHNARQNPDAAYRRSPYQNAYGQYPNGYPQRQSPNAYRQAPNTYPQRQNPNSYRQAPNGYPQRQNPNAYRQAPNGYPQGQNPNAYRQAPNGYPQRQNPNAYRQAPNGYPQRQNPNAYRQAPNGYPQRQNPNANGRTNSFIPRRRSRESLNRRPGMKGYESTVKQENKLKKYILITLAVVTVLIIAIFAIKAAVTRDIGTLPVNEPVVDTAAAETKAPEEPVDSKSENNYANKTEDTIQLGDTVKCKNAILIDLETNTVTAEKDGDAKIFPASMTKVMTALVALEHCDDLDETFVMTNEIIAPLAAANASVAGFVPGEKVTVRDMLYGTILPSGADATGGLAEFIAGSEDEFAKLMNEKCDELGLTGTHFSDASGLHKEDHYSTCHDIAVIMKAAMENETLREIMGTDTYTTSATEEHPEGILLQDTMYSRIDGKEEFDGKIAIIAGKTGFTDEAGNCLVSVARVEGEEKLWLFVCAGGIDSKWVPIYDTIHVYRTYLGVHFDGEYVPKYMR